MWKLLIALVVIGTVGCTINPPGAGEESVIPEAPESLEEKIAKQRFEVIDEVERIPFAGTINSWGYFDNEAIWVETGPNSYYMLTLSFPCHDLRFTETISIKTRLPQVYKNDEVVIPGRSSANCRIDKIFEMQRIRKSDDEAQNSESDQ